MEIKRIVFPVDFSVRARQSAPLVQAMARRYGASVELLHVLNYAPEVFGTLDYVGQAADVISSEAFAKWRREKEAQLVELAAQPGWAGIAVETRVETGEIATVIVRRAQDAQLIMMPTHGYGPFRRMLLGSNTAKVLHDAPCVVWTDAHADEDGAWRPEVLERVVCAVDLEDEKHDAQLLRVAAGIAQRWGARLEVMHAFPQGRPALGAPPAPPELSGELLLRLSNVVRKAGVVAEAAVLPGWPVEALRTAASTARPDLLILGRGRHHGLGRLGSHAYAMIREAPCPVLSLPAGVEF